MKLSMCILVAVLFVTAIGAADTGYDIGSFRPADLLEYSLSPRFTHNSSYFTHARETNLFTLGNALLLGGTITKETPGYRYALDTSNSSSHSNISNTYPEDGDTESKSASSSIYTTNKAEYKRYFTPFFIGGGVVSSVSYHSQKQIYYYDDGAATYLSTESEILHSLTGNLGCGRMFDCSEAYLAWYYFQELAESDCLSRTITAADTDKLAWAFYHIRSVHEIDFSERNRRQATLVLDCLQDLNCLKPGAESQAMAILLDVWMMSGKLSRQTGIQLEIKPNVHIASTKEKYSAPDANEVTDTHHSYTDDLVIRFNYEHPIRNVFQSSAAIGARGLINDQSDYTAVYTFTYYPDNRSSIYWVADSEMIMSQHQQTDALLPVKFTDKYQRFTLDLSMHASYHLTYRLTASGEVGCQFLHQRHTGHAVYQSKGIATSLNLSYRLY